MAKILVVDDEKPISNIIKFNLEKENYSVITAFDGLEALEKFDTEQPDLVLLDLMLPKKDGFDVAKEIRKTSEVPIIMVSAKDSEIDKVVGLNLGADDYITKPFSNAELMARIKTNLRRRGAEKEAYQKEDSTAPKTLGELTINPENYNVYRDNEEIPLTRREFELLFYLLERNGHVVKREELLDEVWGYDYFGDARTVDVTIRRLREKVERDPGRPRYVHTRRGIGYFVIDRPIDTRENHESK